MFSFKNIFYIAFFFTPILMFFGSSSFMVGTLLTAIISMSFRKFNPSLMKIYYSSAAIIFFIFIVNCLMMISNRDYVISRFVFSWLVLIIALVSSLHLYLKFEKTNKFDIDKMMNYSYYLFVVIGIIGCTDILSLNQNYIKSMFPFSEPSHYAIYLAPILIYIVRMNKLGYIYLIPFIFISFFIQNFTILVVIALAFICRYKLKSLFFLPLIVLYVLNSNINLSYFESRLNISNSNDNLSTLVYLQGLDIIDYSIFTKNGMGMGFQQLGFNGVTFPSTERLRFLLDRDMNLTDGGFTLAKIIGEFGFLSIIILVLYFKYFYKSFKIIFAKNSDSKIILCSAFVISYSIELFVRGLGYFNVSLLFLIMAILYIKSKFKPT